LNESFHHEVTKHTKVRVLACFVKLRVFVNKNARDMTVEAWLESAIADATRRGLPQLKPLLESLAQTMRTLRAADVYLSPLAGETGGTAEPPPR
jgi:hypothetical protein